MRNTTIKPHTELIAAVEGNRVAVVTLLTLLKEEIAARLQYAVGVAPVQTNVVAVVTLFGGLDGTIAAELEAAGGIAPIPTQGVAIITLFSVHVDDRVAADLGHAEGCATCKCRRVCNLQIFGNSRSRKIRTRRYEFLGIPDQEKSERGVMIFCGSPHQKNQNAAL